MEKKPGSRLIHFIKIAFAIWFLCILGVIGTFIYVVGIRKELFNKTPKIFAFTLLGLILLGGLTFCLGFLGFVIYKVKEKSSSEKKPNLLISLLKIFILFAVLPLFLIWIILQPKGLITKFRTSGIRGLLKGFSFKSFLARTFALGVTTLVILPVWVGGYVVAGILVQERLNLVTEPVTIAGTGSMYPTFPKGQGKTIAEQTKEIVGTPGMTRYPTGFELWGKHFFSYGIGRGDIVAFLNDKTKEITEKENGHGGGFVKRVMAIPGDIIEIRDGIFYLNGKPQKEPYTAVARSTFGGQFLSECTRLTVPTGKLFVMGDNRKGSGDSRQELGLISYADINHVIPWAKQKGSGFLSR